MAVTTGLILVPILIYAAYCDLRYMRIPNAISLALTVLFALSVLVAPPADLASRIAVAAAIFAIGYIGFSLRLVGGGDVKFLAALALFVPASALVLFANLFSAALLLGVAFIVAAQRSPLAQAGWKSFSARGRFPMGLSISMAGLALITLSLRAIW